MGNALFFSALLMPLAIPFETDAIACSVTRQIPATRANASRQTGQLFDYQRITGKTQIIPSRRAHALSLTRSLSERRSSIRQALILPVKQR